MQYYSDKTKQLYVKKEELIAAEKEWDKAHALELKKADERKNRAKAVEDAWKEYTDLQKECEAKLKEKKTAYYELRNAFIKDYGSYHSTVSSIVNLADILDQMFIF